MSRSFALAAFALFVGCTATSTPAATSADVVADTVAASDASTKTETSPAIDAATAASITEYVATLADFDCVKNGEKVGHFYVANKLGHQTEAVAVAKANAKGSAYPLGTVIRLFPLEAMVKRGKGFDATGGWEMFKLKNDGSGLAIEMRGGAEVKNSSGTCFGCHNPAKDFDFVCGTDHGCAALGVTDDLVKVLQDNDGQCSK